MPSKHHKFYETDVKCRRKREREKDRMQRSEENFQCETAPKNIEIVERHFSLWVKGAPFYSLFLFGRGCERLFFFLFYSMPFVSWQVLFFGITSQSANFISLSVRIHSIILTCDVQLSECIGVSLDSITFVRQRLGPISSICSVYTYSS